MRPREDRPVIRDLALSRFDVAALVVSGVIVLATIVGLSVVWNTLPLRIPTHFGITGAPNAWAGRSSLLVLAGIPLALNVVLFAVQRVPELYNFPVRVTKENARDLYTVMRRMLIVMQLALNVVFASLVATCVLVANGVLAALPIWWTPAVLFALTAITVWGVRAARRVEHAHRRVIRP